MLILLLFVICATFLAVRVRFFQCVSSLPFPSPTLLQAGGAFLTYIGVSMVSAALIFFLKGNVDPRWVNLFYLIVLFCGVALYLIVLPRPCTHRLFWGSRTKSLSHFWSYCRSGLWGWVIAFPYVLLINHVAGWVARAVWGEQQKEQVAVKFLKSTLDSPALLAAAIFCVVFLVPFVEEVLFRGFLQGWLRKFCGKRSAVLTGGVFFTAVHYAPHQSNFEILSGLFILALFLGVVYEKERSLFAPWVLHAAFNATTVCVLIFSAI